MNYRIFICFHLAAGCASFSSRHGIIFETLGSLLSLLRTGDRDAYRQFFEDVMSGVEGTNHKHTKL